MTQCPIEKAKRSRVKGDGPRRTEMVTFAKIGEVSPHVVDNLNAIADERKQNDLGSDVYNISQLCDVENVFANGKIYRQVLIQEKNCEEDSTDEHVYTEYNSDVSVPFFEQIYRLRVSELAPKAEINWHIDTDTSVLCRAQICLNDNDSVMFFDRKGSIEECRMKKGEIWFINTGWKHSVQCGEKLRRHAIFGFDYKDYKGDVHLLSNS